MGVLLSVLLTASAALTPVPAAEEAGEFTEAGVDPVRVEIRGISGDLRRNVRSHLSILTVQEAEGALERRVRRLHDRAEREIRTALEPFGHYRPDVEAELSQVGPDRWRATYRIDPGPVVPVREVDVRLLGEGSRDEMLLRVVERSDVREGEALRHPEYERLKNRLLAGALNRGYLDARFLESRVEVDLDRYAARVRLHLDTGPRYRFGSVEFTDTTEFSPSFYRRLVPFEEGTPYSLSRLVEFQNLLAASGYFRTAEVDAPRERAEDLRVPVVARLEPRPRSALSLGVGASTDLGPRASGEWRARWLNRAGHRFSVESRVALHRQTAGARYAVPVGMPGHEEFSGSAGFRREEFETVDSRSLQVGLGVTHRRGSWQETAQLRLEREWFTVGEDRDSRTLVLPRLAWSRDARDEALQPTRGERLSLEIQGTSTALGSGVGFAQTEIDGKLIRSLYSGGRVLFRGTLGLTAVDVLEELPASFRFFTGGDQSVRGFSYKSIGPVDADDNVIGGRHLAVASLELDQRVVGPFGAAVFVDAGTAARSFSGLDDPSVGAGVGARWRSPVGPVRLDVAFAVSEPDTPVRLHFVLGPDL